jgi:uncharacterized protein (TIGR02594 family)
MDLQRIPAFSWYLIARKEIGVKEIVGSKHNPRIIEYHATTTLKATTDEVPWCSSFVNWCISKAGYTPTRSAAARSWATWGQRIDKPVKGCIVVMTRDGGGHVGFYESEAEGIVRVLGGNQANGVNVRPYKSERILAYVIPKKMSIEDETAYAVLRALV